MKKNSILSELTTMANKELAVNLFESRSQHIISSVIYLIEDIERTFPEEEAENLKRKLVNSIKFKDPTRFTKAVHKTKDNNE